MKKWIIFGFFALAAAVGSSYYFLSQKTIATSSEVNWNLLSELDYTEHIVPDKLKKLDQTYIRVPGFMVPLEDSNRLVTEFLLVPSPQACIHVPAPPPNQMIYVKMQKGVTAAFGPVWVYGKLLITTKGSQYGDSAYQMEADKVENYD